MVKIVRAVPLGHQRRGCSICSAGVPCAVKIICLAAMRGERYLSLKLNIFDGDPCTTYR